MAGVSGFGLVHGPGTNDSEPEMRLRGACGLRPMGAPGAGRDPSGTMSESTPENSSGKGGTNPGQEHPDV
jgi:hypothetical protein